MQMAKKYVFGVDLGTTAFKAALFDDQGHNVASHVEEHHLLTPAALTVEQEPEVYWNCFKTSIAEVMKKSAVSPADVAAISLSVQGETLIFLDEQMHPLHNFIVWMDTRPQQEAEEINEWFPADEVLRVTGQGPITSLYPAAKVLWFSKHYPQQFAKAKKMLLLDDYMFYRMGGVFKCQGSNWCSSYMWNINSQDFWPEMVEKLGLSREQLPETVPTGTPLGTMLPEVAAELGLSPDTLLVAGGLDQACGATGVGNAKPGIFSESTGAELVVCTMSEKQVLDEKGELPCFFGVAPGLYMLHAGTKGGIVLRWLRDTVCTEELRAEKETGRDSYLLMDELAAEVPAGSDGLVVLPFFGGSGAPHTDQYAKGMIYGLGLQHTRAHLIRAVMEATALSVRKMVEYCEHVTGDPVTQIRSLGGASRSPLWCQIKADMLGREVVTMKNTQDAACLGAAIIAGVGAGIWSSISDTALRLAEVDKVYTPDPSKKAAYDELVHRYDVLVDAVGGHTRELA